MSIESTSSSICDLYVVRHGQTDDNKSPNWGSPNSTPLNLEGWLEVEEVRDQLRKRGVRFDFAITSNTTRTEQTARCILNEPSLRLVRDDSLSEMRLGDLPDMTPPGIIRSFIDETKYPDPSSRHLTQLWAKLNGKPITEANDCYLDHWRNDADTFDGYKKERVPLVVQIGLQHLGTTGLFSSHSTLLKSVVAEALKIPNTSVKPLTGCWVHSQINSKGEFKYIESYRVNIKN